MLNPSLFSSDKEEWYTPLDFYNKLNEELHFKCDPCTTLDNRLGCEVFYTKQDDGLTKDWISPTFCNPPYGRKAVAWVKKAVQEQKKGVTVVMLLAARVDTQWFHDYIYNKTDVEIRFIKGRIKFEGGKDSAPFPSMVVIFRGLTK